MPKIFISYRRNDSQYVTDAIFLQFEKHFGEGNVFLDVGSIPFGVDFRHYLREQIAVYDVVLVIIGTEWASIMQERAESPDDFVRLEIEIALSLDKLVVPVLVMEAKMPNFSQLPPSIADLQWRNSANVRRYPDLLNDCERIATGLKTYLQQKNQAQAIPSLSSADLQAKIEVAEQFKGTLNSGWTPVIVKLGDIEPTTPLPDMEMCLVPVGQFMLGNDPQAFYWDDEQENWLQAVPEGGEQQIKSAYWVARYPISNAQWQKAVAAGAVQEPSDRTWYQDRTMAACPVVYVDWLEVRKFALWAKCDLPTEVHWEYAARGLEHWAYPWGNDFQAENVVYGTTNSKNPQAVTAHPNGASWIGAQDLSGNVWEWCLNAYQDYPYTPDKVEQNLAHDAETLRALRGGSWFVNEKILRAASRFCFNAAYTFNDVGGRCYYFKSLE